MALFSGYDPPDRKWVIAGSFILGCNSTISQVYLFREEMNILAGNELALALLLCGWLVGIWIGALLAGKYLTRNRIGEWLFYSLLGIPILFSVAVTGIRLAPQILSLPITDYPSPGSMILIAMGAVIPMGLWIGSAFPVLSLALDSCRRISRNGSGSETASVIGMIFTWESLGSVIAGLSLVYIIIPRWDAYTSAGGMGGIVLLLLYCMGKRSRLRWGLLGGFILIVISLILSIPQAINAWSVQYRWQNRRPGYQLKKIKETAYQRLELGERESQYTLFGNGSPLFSFPNEYENAQWVHLALSQYPDPKSILFIGSGGGNMIQHFLEHKPDSLVWVETDPGILETISFSMDSLAASSPVETVHADPRGYLAALSPQQKFSVIAVHQPDPTNGVFNRFYTREFFQLVRAHLENQGVFVFTVSGTPNYEYGDVGIVGAILYWTVHDVFPQMMVVPGMEWWFFASPERVLHSRWENLQGAYRQRRLQCAFFQPEHLSLYYEESHVERLKSVLQTYSGCPRNSDFRPLCYLYTLAVWSKQNGFLKNFPLVQLTISGSSTIGIVLLGGGLLFCCCWGGIRTGVRDPSAVLPLLSLAATGLSAMGAQVVLLLFYQSRVGCLYQQLGWFFGVFMFGLALGATGGSRWVTQSNIPSKVWLRRIDLGYTFLLGITPLLLELGTSRILSGGFLQFFLVLWMGILAAGSGMLFPIVAKTLEGEGQSLAGISGWTDAADNLGGALGALVTGMFLLPGLGINPTFGLLVWIKILNQAALRMSGRRKKQQF